MEGKKLATILLFSLTFILMVGMVQADNTLATATLTRPASNALVQGTYLLNATIVGATSNASTFNLTYQAKSIAATANGTWVTVCKKVLVNFTDQQINKSQRTNCTLWNNNATGATKGQKNASGVTTLYGDLEDGTDYSFRLIVTECNDTTNTATSTALTSIDIDYTLPTTPTSLLPANHNLHQDGNINIVINATVIGANTTNCTLEWTDITPTGTNQHTMNHTSNTCNISISSVPDGVYSYRVRATDGTNTSAWSATQEVIFSNGEASPLGKAYVLGSAGTPIDGIVPDGGMGTSGIAVIVILLIIGYIYVNRNK